MSGFSYSHCYWYELIVTKPESRVQESSFGFQELVSEVDSLSVKLSVVEQRQR